MHHRIAQSAGQIIGQMSGLQVIGLDIAKNVFQLRTVEMSTGEIVNVQLKRAKVLGDFATAGCRLRSRGKTSRSPRRSCSD